jgi:hypothetical protein
MNMNEIQLSKIDELGLLQAQIAELEAKAKILSDQIKNEGEGHYEGNLFKGCVTLSQRATVDSKAVFKAANVPAELIAANTKTTAIITLKVTAR